MVFACSRNVNDLALHGFHKWGVLTFGVYNNYIGVRVGQNDVRHFLFRCERFARTRHTEDKRITVQQVAAVGNNHVL